MSGWERKRKRGLIEESKDGHQRHRVFYMNQKEIYNCLLGNEHGTIRHEADMDLSDRMGPAVGIIHHGHAARLRNGKLDIIPVDGAKSPHVDPHHARPLSKSSQVQLTYSCKEDNYLPM